MGVIGGQHGPRVKVSNLKNKFDKNDCFVVNIAKFAEILTPNKVKLKQEDVDLVLDWIKLNYEVLRDLWKEYENSGTSTKEIIKKLKKI